MTLARDQIAVLAALQAAAACDPDALPRLVLTALARLVPADGHVAWLRDEDDPDAVRTVVVVDGVERRDEGLVAADPLLTGILLGGARSVAAGDGDRRGATSIDSSASVAAAPIEIGSTRLGALAAIHADGTSFAQGELDLLALAGSTLALTLVAISGREERERSFERATLLASTMLGSALADGTQRALDQVADGARDIACSPLVAILLAGPDGTRLAASSGDATAGLLDLDSARLAPLLDVFEPGPLSRGEPFLHVSMPSLLSRLAPQTRGVRARARDRGLRAALVCPLTVPTGVVGILLIGLADTPLDPPMLPPLTALAAHTGGLLARAQSDPGRSGRDAALALAAALAERDPLAGLHARVVSGFDIGKLALADRILEKRAACDTWHVMTSDRP